MAKNKSKTHLIIPDSHAHPEFHNKRYEYIGHLINDVKPDVVVDIGDWYDMPSLCSYDRGTRDFEGRRYRSDINAGLDAQDRLLTIVRRQKQKLPRFVRTLGNHEQRIVKAVESDPILEGTIGLSDLMSKEYKWEEHPFLEVAKIDGINYAHYFMTGISGRPVGGEHIGYALLCKKFESSTQGHSHLLDHCTRTREDGTRMHGLSCGVYQDYNSKYAGSANRMWWRGLVLKRNVENGNYDPEFIGMKRLQDAYGRL